MSFTRQGREQWRAEVDSRGIIKAEWAEKYATGAICSSWEKYLPYVEGFDRNELFSPELRLVWDAADSLANDGQPVNVVTIAEQMTQARTIEELPDGVHFLMELMDQTEDAHSPFHFTEWLKIISRAASLRRFMAGAYTILRATEGNHDLESMRSAMSRLLEEVPQERDRREMILSEAVDSELEKIEAGEPEAFHVTIPEVDGLTKGFAPAELVVIAARPGQCKTMIACQLVDHAAQRGFPSLIVSEEMGIDKLARRSIPRIVSIEKEHWQQEINRVRFEARDHFERCAPIVVREFCVSIDRVERAIASAVSRYGVKFVVVDYAQLIAAKGMNRYEQTTEVSVRMKRAANRHGITVFLLAQLGRGIDTRDGFVPIMSDLKDTGQLEQDADIILAGVWPYKFDESYPDSGEYRLYQLKNRNRGVSRYLTKFYVDAPRQRLLSMGDKPMPEWS